MPVIRPIWYWHIHSNVLFFKVEQCRHVGGEFWPRRRMVD